MFPRPMATPAVAKTVPQVELNVLRGGCSVKLVPPG